MDAMPLLFVPSLDGFLSRRLEADVAAGATALG
jgi:hypothetical protein